jgi:hypothetical protein
MNPDIINAMNAREKPSFPNPHFAPSTTNSNNH